MPVLQGELGLACPNILGAESGKEQQQLDDIGGMWEACVEIIQLVCTGHTGS